MSSSVRRKLSLACLLAAWLCANGVTWNVVQVVGWAQMFRDNARSLPLAQAIAATFDGSAPCAMCHLAQSAEDTARRQLPADELGTGAEKFLLACQLPAPVILVAPEAAWPGAAADTGPTRTDAVPVRPPRA